MHIVTPTKIDSIVWEGDWNLEEFLIMEPGRMVVASHDDKIIDVRKCL